MSSGSIPSAILLPISQASGSLGRGRNFLLWYAPRLPSDFRVISKMEHSGFTRNATFLL
jgi:hypothetical protein